MEKAMNAGWIVLNHPMERYFDALTPEKAEKLEQEKRATISECIMPELVNAQAARSRLTLAVASVKHNKRWMKWMPCWSSRTLNEQQKKHWKGATGRMHEGSNCLPMEYC